MLFDGFEAFRQNHQVSTNETKFKSRISPLMLQEPSFVFHIPVSMEEKNLCIVLDFTEDDIPILALCAA